MVSHHAQAHIGTRLGAYGPGGPKGAFLANPRSTEGLNAQQVKVLNRLLDAGPEGFEGGLTAGKYKSMAKVSKATATRRLAELQEKGCIVKQDGGGRSTRYQVNWPGGKYAEG